MSRNEIFTIKWTNLFSVGYLPKHIQGPLLLAGKQRHKNAIIYIQQVYSNNEQNWCNNTKHENEKHSNKCQINSESCT